jgi:hypothetical protein
MPLAQIVENFQHSQHYQLALPQPAGAFLSFIHEKMT